MTLMVWSMKEKIVFLTSLKLTEFYFEKDSIIRMKTLHRLGENICTQGNGYVNYFSYCLIQQKHWISKTGRKIPSWEIASLS
jgi:hypothetical protein